MDLCHDSDFNMHAGRESTLQDLKSRYHWEGVDNDLKVYLRHCLWCRRAKSVLPRRAGKLQQALHQHSGSLVSMDLVSMPRTRDGYDYILTVLDAFSHYLIAVPIKSKSATAVLDAFITHVMLQGLLPSRVVSVGGELKWQKGRIVSDNGSELKNVLMQRFLDLFEITGVTFWVLSR